VGRNYNRFFFHSHALRSYTEDVAAFASLVKKKPIVISAHGGININWDYSDKIPKMIYDATLRRLKRLNDIHYIAVTKTEIPIIKNYGIEEEKIHYIPNAVAINTFKPLESREIREKYGIEADTDLILYVGRIAKGKGLDKLIKIFHYVHQNNNNTKLMVIGPDYGYMKVIKPLIQKYGLAKHIIFSGFISKEHLPKYYSAADLVVYPSRQEIFGIVLLEANACGKPVIGSNILGPSEIIKNGYNGFKFDFRNLDKVSDLISELLEDKQRLKKLGQNGIKRVKKNYTVKKNAERHIALYKKLISK
jgi:glycosyltransferase involved in cell wall biosynthesis